MGPYNKALVTGGAGFIGSHLSKALFSQGVAVVILDDLSMGKMENVPADAAFVRGDVRSQEDVSRVLDGVDIVFHEAARVSIRTSVREFYEDAQTNLMGTLNLLRCCAQSDVKKVIFASSMAVYSDGDASSRITEDYLTEPISPYGISKLASEKYCLHFSRETGISCNVLRYFNTYGPGQAFTPYVGVITIFINRLLKKKSPVIFGDGKQRRDFVHVSDIVSANILSMQADLPIGILNVGTGRGTSVYEIAEMLCHEIAPDVRPVYAASQPGELRYSVADIGRAEKALGYGPSASLQRKMAEVIEYLKKKK